MGLDLLGTLTPQPKQGSAEPIRCNIFSMLSAAATLTFLTLSLDGNDLSLATTSVDLPHLRQLKHGVDECICAERVLSHLSAPLEFLDLQALRYGAGGSREAFPDARALLNTLTRFQQLTRLRVQRPAVMGGPGRRCTSCSQTAPPPSQ